MRQTDVRRSSPPKISHPQKQIISPHTDPHEIFCTALHKLICIESSFYILRAYFKPKMNNAEACRDKCGQFLYEKGEKNTVFEKIFFFLQNCFSLIFLYDHPEDDPDL